MAASARELRLEPIARDVARRFIAEHHYSGKNAGAQRIYLGVFDRRALVGAMSWGRPIDIRKANKILQGAAWKSILELGRLAMLDDTPPNSESRMIAVAIREITRRYPHVELLQTYADAAQCGHGTIYQATGFLLVSARKNKAQMQNTRTGEIDMKLTRTKGNWLRNGAVKSSDLQADGWQVLPGFQLRYVKPLRPGVRERLTLPVLPYSAVDDVGARMYKGQRVKDSSEPLAVPGKRGRGSTDPRAPLSAT